MKKTTISPAGSLDDTAQLTPAEADLPFPRSKRRRIEAVHDEPLPRAADPDKTVMVRTRWTADAPAEPQISTPTPDATKRELQVPANTSRPLTRWLAGQRFRQWLSGVGHCLPQDHTPTLLEAMTHLGEAEMPRLLRGTVRDLIDGQRHGEALSTALANTGLLADSDIRTVALGEHRGTLPLALQQLSAEPLRPDPKRPPTKLEWTLDHPLCELVALILRDALEQDYDEVQVLIDPATGKGFREGFQHHNLARIEPIPHAITPAILRILMTLARVPYWTPTLMRGGIQHRDIPGRWMVRAQPQCIRLRRIARAYERPVAAEG